MKLKLIQTLIFTCLSLILVEPTENKKIQVDTNGTIVSDADSIEYNTDGLVPTETIEEEIVKEIISEEIIEKTEIKKEEEVVAATIIEEIENNSSDNKKEKVEQRQENSQEVQTTKSNKTSIGTFKLTAYCPCYQCCGKWTGGKTASGTIPTQGRTVAIDTSVIPFGTKVVINGNTYVAEDTGSAIKGNRIDVFFNSHQEALNFGVQYAEIFVYDN